LGCGKLSLLVELVSMFDNPLWELEFALILWFVCLWFVESSASWIGRDYQCHEISVPEAQRGSVCPISLGLDFQQSTTVVDQNTTKV
jgi:hypothetical protein